MSTPMTMLQQRIRIPAAYKSRALTALQQMPEPQSLRFTDRAFVHVDTLEEALACFRWQAVIDAATGDITGLHFIGINAGPVHFLWQVLAPYVVEDSFMICTTEDGQRWRWHFKEFVVWFTEESDI